MIFLPSIVSLIYLIVEGFRGFKETDSKRVWNFHANKKTTK